MSEVKQSISLYDIENALKNNEFELYYQPKVSMVTGEIVGAEALIRWQKKDGTLIPPMDFIPLAESTNVILDITHYVFKKLIIDYAIINTVNESLRVSFNTSGKDFYDEVLTDIIIEAVNHGLIKADNLEIEVTETVLCNEEYAKYCLSKLSDLGICISMDDFGTGHSGLAELSKWPFSILKIDQKFILGLGNSIKDREILQASIRMAHQLNMNVVAEGIEDKETYRVLQEYGCRIGQGYWISKPLPLHEFIPFLKQFTSLPAMPIGLLYMAQLDHLQWRKTLIDTALFLHSTKERRDLKNLRGIPELKHTHCKLGLWYYDLGRTFKNLDSYVQLEQPHIELHEIGLELLNIAREHCDMDDVMHLIQRLSEKSLKVLQALQALENDLHLEQYSNDEFHKEQ